MQFDPFGATHTHGPLDRFDARIKLVTTLAFVIAVVLTPIGWWGILALEAVIFAIILAISRLPVSDLARRWIRFAPLVLFLAAVIAPGHPARPSFGFWAVWGTIVAKNSLAFGAIVVLSAVTPFARILTAMRQLGVPSVLVATLHFMVRYIHVLGEELGRMVQARRARSFRRNSLDFGMLTGLIGVLFVRAMERGERVHNAMLARGWDGSIRSLDDGMPDR
jgi:cobalt/nickel transport system permease protein